MRTLLTAVRCNPTGYHTRGLFSAAATTSIFYNGSHRHQILQAQVPVRQLHWRANLHLHPPFTMIADPISDPQLTAHTSWGFSIYRCSYSDETAWQHMLQKIETSVKRILEIENRMDLLPRHELIVHNGRTKFDSATSHEIRDHFRVWAAHEAMNRLADPKPGDLEVMLKGDRHHPGPDWFLGARYNFCLFVDDICLESLSEMHSPVVKFLWKQWGHLEDHERAYSVHPEWHDGSTAEEEEDVGWMYMSVLDYVEWYEMFHEPEYWYDAYVRPPNMYCTTESPGFWRKS